MLTQSRRLNNKSATVRQQAADLISRIAMVMKQCGEDALMGKLGVVLYEYLGRSPRNSSTTPDTCHVKQYLTERRY